MSRTKFSTFLLALTALLTLGAGSAALAGTITGTVTGTDGKPAGSVKVRLVKLEDAPGKPAQAKDPAAKLAKDAKLAKNPAKAGGKHGTTVAESATNADGTFTFENVADGSYIVIAGGKGAGGGKAEVTVSGATPATVSITLKEKAKK
jgi:5-hydroxyisourate hydrolase-like protein (transthyretin family)